MSRGDRREQIFLDGVGRQDFIKTLAAACQKTNWQVPAYCLLPNHYHLVLETPKPKLLAGMAWLQSPYTIRLNHRHLGGSKGVNRSLHRYMRGGAVASAGHGQLRI
ncbi:MAG: transposase [Verrucomicrobiota bacterium]